MFIQRIQNLNSELESIGATAFARICADKKSQIFIFKISALKLSAALILKQESLSAGGDFITPKELILGEQGLYSGILIATALQLEKIIAKCAIQPFGLKKVGAILAEHLSSGMCEFMRKSRELCVDLQLDSCESPLNSPASWCKKSDSKDAEVPSADFLLEADKRGSPPKSEKWQLLARSGSGAGGAALLQKKTSGSKRQNGNNSADFPKSPQIMGIINITPDSFYEDSRTMQIDKILQKIEAMIACGVAIIDIGAASSRPDSEQIAPQVELERLREPIEAIFSAGFTQKAIFSIDSYNYECAKFCANRGFTIINDVYGLRDMRLAELALENSNKIVLMHNSWLFPPPKNAQGDINIIRAVDEFFAKKLESLDGFGIKKEQIILDIGFGFGKNDEQNLALTRNLFHFKHFGCELLVGASMKRTIGFLLGGTLTGRETQNRLFGTLALHQIALDNGADIIRCHDFNAHSDMLKVWIALNCGDLHESNGESKAKRRESKKAKG